MSDNAGKLAPEALDPVVAFLARLAGSGATLEFAIGAATQYAARHGADLASMPTARRTHTWPAVR